MRKIDELKEKFKYVKNIKLKDLKDLDQNKVDEIVTKMATELEDRDFSMWSMYTVDQIKEYLYKKYLFIDIVELLNKSIKTGNKYLVDFNNYNCGTYNIAIEKISRSLDIIEKTIDDYNRSIEFYNVPYLEIWYKCVEEMFDIYETQRKTEKEFRATKTYKKYFKNIIPSSITNIKELRDELYTELKRYQKGDYYYPTFDNDMDSKEYWGMLDCKRFHNSKWNGNFLRIINDKMELIKDINNFEYLEAHDNVCAQINKLIQWGLTE